MISTDTFFLVKGLVGLVATVLYIYHMSVVIAHLRTMGQRMRYFALLLYAVLVTSSSVGQATTPNIEIHWWNVASLIATAFLAVTAIVSIRDFKRKKHV